MNLNKIAAALRELADALEEDQKTEAVAVVTEAPPVEETKPAPEEEAPAFAMFAVPPAEEKAPAPTREITNEDISAAFQALSMKIGQQQAQTVVMGLLGQMGLAKVSDGSPEQRLAVWQGLQEKANG